MTNKQSWIEDISAWCFSRNLTNGDFASLSKEISNLLTSKSEQMEREIQKILGKYLSKVDEDGEQYDPTDIILVKISQEIKEILKK